MAKFRHNKSTRRDCQNDDFQSKRDEGIRFTKYVMYIILSLRRIYMRFDTGGGVVKVKYTRRFVIILLDIGRLCPILG